MDRRNSERVQTRIATICRVPAAPHRAKVHDLSEFGCRLGFERDQNVPVGSTIYLQLGQQSVTGMAVWSSCGACGVKFERGLPTLLAIEMGVRDAPVVVTPPPSEGHPAEMPEQAMRLPHWLRKLIGAVA